MDSKVAIFRATTSGLQGKAALDGFREHFGRTILRLEMMPVDGHALACDVAIRALPDVAIATGKLSPMRNHHPEALGDDSLVLAVLQQGHAEFHRRGSATTVSAGEAVLTAGEDAGTFTGHTATRLANIRLKRALLATHVVDPYAAVGVAINGYALRLLLSYADVLGDAAVTMTPDGRRVITDNIYDLAALTIGGVHDARAHLRGVRAARLHRLKADIHKSLAQHDLSITGLAKRHGISGSYARRLFAEAGTSFADFVLEQRLLLAHRHLTDPAQTHRTISAIAYDVGFNDLSYFNRRFRQRYGLTPSDARAAGR